MRVLKFGGTSVGTAACLRTVIDVIARRSAEGRTVIVVSALGGVTDELLGSLETALSGNTDRGALLARLRGRHLALLDGFAQGERASDARAGIEEWLSVLDGLLHGVALIHQCPPSTRDAVLSTGERLSLPVVVAALAARGIRAVPLDAAAFIRTDDVHGEAAVDLNASFPLVRTAVLSLPPEDVAVVSGFIGTCQSGVLTTLGRRGSDYTAAVLGNLLDARSVEIWTDTDGVMSADPRVVQDAATLPSITYREATDLAFYGAGVLHPKTMAPLEAKGIPLVIRNTYRPEAPGTTVVLAPTESGQEVKSVTSVSDATLVSLRCRRDFPVKGLYLRLFSTLERLKTPVFSVHQSASDGSLSFVTLADRGEEIAHELRREFSVELQAGAVSAIESRSNLSVVAAVGNGVIASPEAGRRFYQTLERADIRPVAVSQGGVDLTISAIVEQRHERRAVTALHRTFFRRRVHVAIAGPTGMVGTSLVRLFGEQQAWLRDERDLELSIVGAINTRNMVWNDHGLPMRGGIDDLRTGTPAHWESFRDRLMSHNDAPLVFLDCTASESIARQYATLLRSDVAIVTPNKIANTLEFAYYEELKRLGDGRGARYLYETTVGAATPMLQTLEDLRRTGDTIRRVEGVLSGTLSYVFNCVNRGELFSHAVREASRRGFTEPHPATDLSGNDVARKLLILAREAGYPLEREQISVESLVPADLGHIRDANAYLERLSSFDSEWADRALLSSARGHLLAYLARFDGTRASVGITEVPAESPFVRLRASENAVHYYTDRHAPFPLTIQGIGAGPEVTARGVFADLIHAALDLAA